LAFFRTSVRDAATRAGGLKSIPTGMGGNLQRAVRSIVQSAMSVETDADLAESSEIEANP
jgi:hypothetical protein